MDVDRATTRLVCVPTALGWCALAWRGAAVTRFVLPERDVDAARARARRGRVGVHADAAAATASGPLEVDLDDVELPGWVREALTDVQAALAGTAVDLTWIPTDLTGLSGTIREVYEVTRRIPFGATMTYGQVAAAIGMPGGAQAVGAAMGRNPVPLIVPCHRVVGADGSLVGFSASGGLALKRRLLEMEGAAVVAQRSLF